MAGGEEARALANYGLLTLKALLILVNLDEADIGSAAEIEGEFRGRYGASVGAMCARLEAELGELEPEEAVEFRRELGAAEPAAPRILKQVGVHPRRGHRLGGADGDRLVRRGEEAGAAAQRG
jgi:ribosome-binding ATPase YchF (GTP1/OBG family)